MSPLAVTAAAAVMLAATTAAATQQGVSALTKWKIMDKCARQAQAAFPDFTADAQAKRDAQLKQCLEANSLPPRQPALPPQPH